MAYTDATADDLQAAFPRFAAVADETVDFWLTRARRSVDETWTEDDYAMGQMLMAAHLMTLQGLGTGTEAEIASSGLSEMESVRSGSFSFTRSKSSSTGGTTSGTDVTATSYGKQWLALARVNVGGPRVMATGTAPYDPWRYPHGEA